MRVCPLLCSVVLVLAVMPHAASAAPGWSRHVPPATARAQAVERLASSQELELAIGLPLRHPDRLRALLQELYDPSSPNFRRYLSPQQFTEAFAPLRSDYQAAIEFAEEHGLTVVATHLNRLLLHVRGPVEKVEKALRVRMAVFAHPTAGRQFYAPDKEPSLDLGPRVLHISGLHNYHLPAPRRVRRVAESTSLTRTGSGPGGAWLGYDFRKAYLPGTSLTGAGQVVGVVAFDGYFPGDIAAYQALTGLPSVQLENVLIDGFLGVPRHRGPGHGNEEVALDIEMVMSMAPGLSKILVYEAPPTASMATVNNLLNRMATDNLAKQLTCSWGFDIDVNTQQIFQQFAAQGQSFFLASGDDGAFIGPVTQPADSPYVTVVGGTILTTDNTGALASELAWEGSGGGISTLFSIPDWQQGIDMSLNRGSTTMRNVPDVAMVAENVWLIANGGLAGPVAGTSIAAPLWAGFTALANEQAAFNGQPPVGFLNPVLYALGKGPTAGEVFNDVIFGNNIPPGGPAQYFASAGYDLCTGWGSPKGTNLIHALLAPFGPRLVISPPLGLIASGPAGGPFTVTAQTYVLTNSGAASLDWTISHSASWLEVSPKSGTLVPGGPAANVIVTINGVATNFLLGEFSAPVQFSDLTHGLDQSRSFRLLVGNGGFETGNFTNWTVAAQEDVNFAYSLDLAAFIGGQLIPGVEDAQFVHSGSYGAFLGQHSSTGMISQTLPTLPGLEYELSFWLSNPAPGTPNLFEVSWNGTSLFDQRDLRAFSWTNLQYVVTAAETNSVLQFRFRNDQNGFGLDDVVIRPAGTNQLGILTVLAQPGDGGVAAGSGRFLAGSTQQIKASAASGWIFTAWNDGNEENPRTVTVPIGEASYTATFNRTATLIVGVEPGPGGFVSGSGNYAVGSQQQIAALPAPGWIFTGWSDGNRENPRTVTVATGEATYTATFSLPAQLVVLAEPSVGGTTSGSGSYAVGSQQEIAATAEKDWSFVGWNDGSSENPRTIDVPAGGRTLTAVFRILVQPARLTVVPLVATAALELRIEGTRGANYTLQASSDLHMWSDLQTFTVDDLGGAHVPISAAGASVTFFRVIHRD